MHTHIKVEGNQQMVMVPVLNLSMMIQLHQSGGSMASLQHVRRLIDLLHKYMADPRQLDIYAQEEEAAAAGQGE